MSRPGAANVVMTLLPGSKTRRRTVTTSAQDARLRDSRSRGSDDRERTGRSAPEIDHGSLAEPRLADAEERPVELHGKRRVRRLLERDDPADKGDARIA